MKPTPPLMDSTMYFLSGEAMCETVSPARSEMSSKVGTGAVGFEFCALLTMPSAPINAKAIEKIKGERRALVLRAFAKARSLYLGVGTLSTDRALGGWKQRREKAMTS